MFRAESTFIWTIGCGLIVSLHSLPFLFSAELFHREDVERKPIHEQATYVGYNDYDSDLRYVRNLYHLIFQNKQNWADDTISIVVHWMVFYMGVFYSLYSAESRRVFVI